MFSNEIIAIIFMFFYMLCALGAYKLGKNYLQSFLCISYVITLCITTKFFDFFGLTTSAGVITYAGIFLATDMMTEKYGKKIGFETVRIGFLTGFLFVIMTQINLHFNPLGFAQEISDAMDVVFGSSLRIMVAGSFAYLFAQHFDVWFYHRIHEWSKGRWLWLRNIGSTVISQFLDSALFFSLAFYGTMPNNVFLEVIIVGFSLKVLIALLDTPFIYISKKIKPMDE